MQMGHRAVVLPQEELGGSQRRLRDLVTGVERHGRARHLIGGHERGTGRAAPAVDRVIDVRESGDVEAGGVAGILLGGFHRQAQRLGVVLAGELRQVPLRPHRSLPGVQALRILASRALHLRHEHLRRDHADDVVRDLVLKDEQVGQVAVVFFRPEVPAARGIDELRSDAHAVGGAADAAFEHVANAELASDLPDVDRLAFVGEARISRNDEQRADAGQRRDDVLDDTVGEELLFQVAAHGGEGEHGDRGLVRQRQVDHARRTRRRGGDAAREGHRKRAHRMVDVLDALLALIDELRRHLALDRAVHRIRDRDPPGCRQLL